MGGGGGTEHWAGTLREERPSGQSVWGGGFRFSLIIARKPARLLIPAARSLLGTLLGKGFGGGGPGAMAALPGHRGAISLVEYPHSSGSFQPGRGGKFL